MKHFNVSRLILIILLSIILCAVFFYFHYEDKKNFNTADGAVSLLSSWDENSYLSQCAFAQKNGEMSIINDVPNDARFFQDINVSEDTVYCLAADVKTINVDGGRGASLSIDNFSIDGSCIYSKSFVGSNEWDHIELVFKTGPDQNLIRLALRLGGYSELSLGEAYFRNISLYSDSSREDYLLLNKWESRTDEDEEDESVWDSEHYKAMFAVMEWAAALSALIMYFCFYRNRNSIGKIEISRIQYRSLLFITIVLGFLTRFLLCLFFGGHDTDMNCFIAWGQDIAVNGPDIFYTAPGHEWYDYPPAYMAVLGILSKCINMAGINPYSVFGKFLYMIPAILADFGCMRLVMNAARDDGFNDFEILTLGSYIFLNPAILYLSGAWGQIDSILSFLLTFSFILLIKEKRIYSGVVYGIAVSTKWQALIFGPVYAAAHIILAVSHHQHKDAFSKIKQTFFAAVSAFAVIIIISLPFKGEQGIFWMVDKFISSASGYEYASIEAYNYLALCGGNWRPAGEFFSPLHLTYYQFGSISIIISIIICISILWIIVRHSCCNSEANYAVFVSATLCMTLIYTFGHYMHERYLLPVLILMPFVYIQKKDRHYLLCAILLSSTTFLNELCAMYVVSKEAMDIVRGTALHTDLIQICSLLEVISCLYFAYIVLRTVINKLQEVNTAEKTHEN